MCDIQAALQVAGAVVSYRQKKVDNDAIRRDQETTRRNADKAYLHDLNKIDQEKMLHTFPKFLHSQAIFYQCGRQYPELLAQAHDKGGYYKGTWHNIDENMGCLDNVQINISQSSRQRHNRVCH